MVHLTKRLQDLREDHDLTQKELAKILGVPPQRVSEWEKGFHEPRLEILLKLADYYDVTLDYLVGRE
jgi:transcriptional regulator with XRE-family HTH domain